MEVQFNKSYSNGTAIVRSTEPMTNNQYYWEIKMIHPVYGTDIMIGVGTAEVRMKYIQDRFVSLLGMDEETWGFSYRGLFHHNGEKKCYAEQFDRGNTIGVHLDLWNGTLSFYKDRQHLGIASSGLKGKTLYAMASSTSARSGMRIVRTCSFPSCLLFLCAAKLRELIPDDKDVLDVINLPPGLNQFLKFNLDWLLDKRHMCKDKMCCVNTMNHPIDFREMVEESSIIHDKKMYNSDYADRRFVLSGSTTFLSQHPQYKRAIKYVEFENGKLSSERNVKKYNVHELSDLDSD